MKIWAEKYPKTWEKFVIQLTNSDSHIFEYDIHEPNKWEEIFNVPFATLFGHLLKFFSENGVEIERLVYYHGGKYIPSYHVKTDFFLFGDFDTPEEAVEKAFEISEE